MVSQRYLAWSGMTSQHSSTCITLSSRNSLKPDVTCGYCSSHSSQALGRVKAWSLLSSVSTSLFTTADVCETSAFTEIFVWPCTSFEHKLQSRKIYLMTHTEAAKEPLSKTTNMVAGLLLTPWINNCIPDWSHSLAYVTSFISLSGCMWIQWSPEQFLLHVLVLSPENNIWIQRNPPNSLHHVYYEKKRIRTAAQSRAHINMQSTVNQAQNIIQLTINFIFHKSVTCHRQLVLIPFFRLSVVESYVLKTFHHESVRILHHRWDIKMIY